MPENMSFITVNHPIKLADNLSETDEIIKSFKGIFFVVILTLLFTIFGQNL